jgi:hypothetical protein
MPGLIVIGSTRKYIYCMPAITSKNIFQALLYTLILLVISSCYSNRYFATPDYFTKQPGTLVLKNGEQINGDISVNNMMGNSVVVKSYNDNKKLVYTVKDVAACRLEIGIMEPVSIGREIPQLYTLPKFMERLTPDSFSISLYEAYEKLINQNVMGDVTLTGGVEYDLEYFVHLPYDDSNVVWELSTAILTDHLRNGLDSLFRQCPGLTEKIRSGDPAYDIYFPAQIDINKHFIAGRYSVAATEEKVKKIIAVFGEYEKCRRR